MQTWLDLAILLISLGVILLSAGIFTNGVEWLGKKWGLTEGAVGSVLAAVGTALPESIIPLVAILFGDDHSGHEIGIGAILGAPFMLGTLALFVSGCAVLLFPRGRQNYPRIQADAAVLKRDLTFFLFVYSLAITGSFLPHASKVLLAVLLVGSYVAYVYKTLREGQKMGEESEMEPLYFARHLSDPPLALIVLQVLVAFAGIVGGARFFVKGVSDLAALWGVPPLIFALLVAPVATELPEKFNSVIWLGQNKDTLALGNITGAMVFQSSIIPALGMFLTPWVLTEAALISAVLALLSALFTYLFLHYRGWLDARLIATYGGLFYALYLWGVLSGVID